LDWFGWCTWDAFYKAVNPAGIDEGLQRYTRIKFMCDLQMLGYVIPRFLYLIVF
jgi:hypothetical protein